MRLIDDPNVGDWFIARLDHSRSVLSAVPSGFEAYAVLFHPVYRAVEGDQVPSLFAPIRYGAGDDGQIVYHREVRWADVATANGRVAHSSMEWAAITGDWEYRYGGEQPGIWNVGPQRGSLPLRPTITLTQLLAQHTTTPTRCFFGASLIYSDLPRSLLKLPQIFGSCILTGPLQAIANCSLQPGSAGTEEHRSPNLWWPQDRAWFVNSDYDLQETYLGGSARCIDQLVDHPELEAMRIDPGQRLNDEINPEPAGDYKG